MSTAVSCGEFCGKSLADSVQLNKCTELPDAPPDLVDKAQPLNCSLEQGPTVIYVPTRKETLTIAKYLCAKGVKAASYNAAVICF